MRRQDREVKDLQEMEEIITMCKTCHIGMVDEERPYVVPLNFGYERVEEHFIFYFHCAKEGRKLSILHKNPQVALELSVEGEPVHPETPCNSGYYYSSFMGEGSVEFVEDSEEKCKALSLLMMQQIGKKVTFEKKQADTVCVFKVDLVEYSAKRKPRPVQ
ncbi:pyridoxamine 5'-phosphate oxidase family protein [Anaerosporobacter faecicola]|uniref:pyridoxamine 5'-phosphate oxidase family protein n=1 Tax=Anaerosporobacter faecicola TaxID=2718714 RepID=UPI001439190A|nr:pyridoxamine 5'-phosphate oxidase family protein [Anaerosporobacter faecicola]